MTSWMFDVIQSNVALHAQVHEYFKICVFDYRQTQFLLLYKSCQYVVDEPLTLYPEFLSYSPTPLVCRMKP